MQLQTQRSDKLYDMFMELLKNPPPPSDPSSPPPSDSSAPPPSDSSFTTPPAATGYPATFSSGAEELAWRMLGPL